MTMEIRIMKNILDRNQNKADEVRKLLSEKNVKMVNIISSPGAGKTTAGTDMRSPGREDQYWDNRG
jgi:stage III sporulation protein SpoIIIAA